jgi:hypothetical protein
VSDGWLNAMLDPDAVKLATELDGLPLALATAGAYLDQTGIGFSGYLRLYKASWAKLLETRTGPQEISFDLCQNLCMCMLLDLSWERC